MNPVILQYIDDLRILLGAYLDKLKVKNPLAFTLIVTSLLGVNMAIIFGKLSVGVEYDPYVVAFLSMFNTYLSPRTSKEREEYKTENQDDSNVELLPSDSPINPTCTNEHECSVEDVQEL